MAARSKLLIAFLLLTTNACAGGASGEEFLELRQLPAQERIRVFNDLDQETKIELFFEANRRHPPYTGLNSAFAGENKDFLIRLREELNVRGGVPEVLSFMSIALDMKTRGLLSNDDIYDLRVDGICQLAERSEYCATLEAKLLALKPTQAP